MIDLHTHVLPAVDDGVASLDEAVEVVRDAHERGVTTLVATPHVREDYPTTATAMSDGVAHLRAALADAGIGVEVAPGGEIALEQVASLDPDDLVRFSLGGSARYVLLEFPYQGWPALLGPVVQALADQGMTGVLAHPERNAEIIEDTRRLATATADGCLVQVTAASLTGVFGRAVARATSRLIELGLVSVIASDLHGPGRRADAFAEAIDLLDDSLADFLTREAPACILRGDAVPPTPGPSTRRIRGRLSSIGRR